MLKPLDPWFNCWISRALEWIYNWLEPLSPINPLIFLLDKSLLINFFFFLSLVDKVRLWDKIWEFILYFFCLSWFLKIALIFRVALNNIVFINFRRLWFLLKVIDGLIFINESVCFGNIIFGFLLYESEILTQRLYVKKLCLDFFVHLLRFVNVSDHPQNKNVVFNSYGIEFFIISETHKLS